MDIRAFREKYFCCVLDKDGNILFTPYSITMQEKNAVKVRAAEYYESMKKAWRQGVGTSEFLDDDLTLDQYTAVICAQEKYGVRYWLKAERAKNYRNRREMEILRRECGIQWDGYNHDPDAQETEDE